MASTPSEPVPPKKPTWVWHGMAARLRDAFQAEPATSEPTDEEVMPAWDEGDIPLAKAVTTAAEEVPVAAPLNFEDWPGGAIPEATPLAAATPVGEVPAQPPAGQQLCGFCQAPRVGAAEYCLDCGLLFPAALAPATTPTEAPAVPAAPPTGLLMDRYEVQEPFVTRGKIVRYRGLDHGVGGSPQPIVLAQMPLPRKKPDTSWCDLETAPSPSKSGIPAGAAALGAESVTSQYIDESEGLNSAWPGLGWERLLLERARHPGLPRLLDHFAEGHCYYLVEEQVAGSSLWDAWDDPLTKADQRFEWLAELAEALKALHDAGALVEGLRPDIVTITPTGHAVLNDLTDLLPLPLPENPPLQATMYTAPELVFAPDEADARADLYSFGAMIYALQLGRELTELDFERQGVPKPLVMLFPDIHPALARVVMKTFARDKYLRFPTEEGYAVDPTGFSELARTLRAAGRSLARVRLDIASWTTTGMVRSGNEDAFALMHAAASRQDDLGEWALVLLADGMGGYEAGEVASALAIDCLREQLVKEDLFAGLTRDAAPPAGAFEVKTCEKMLLAALREVNRRVFQASRTPGQGRPGMGCTAEALYVDGQRIVVGHVGDSRTYHFSGGRLLQITRDQTLVHRLVELGHLTPEEAETHPRKNELQQAIGGQPDVEPLVYSADLKPGDWVIVCSDGLTNHIDPDTLAEMIQRADSAEMCARRLVNLTNLHGAMDNCTVVAIRAS